MSASPQAVVRDRGYSGYAGPRLGAVAARVLALYTARTLLGQKGVRRAVLWAFVPALITGVVLYFESRTGGGGAQHPISLLVKPYGVIMPAFFVSLAAAGGTLAEDRRAGALSFYFARPLSARDYLLGRLGGVFAAVALTVVGPTTAVAVYRALIAASAADVVRALLLALGVALLGLVLSAILSTYALLAGAVAGSRGAAQSFVGFVFMLPWIGAGIGAKVLDGPWASLLSLPHLTDSIGSALAAALSAKREGLAALLLGAVGGEHDPRLPPLVAALALVVILLGGLWLLHARLTRLAHAGGEGGA
jgi:hypothetical protein